MTQATAWCAVVTFSFALQASAFAPVGQFRQLRSNTVRLESTASPSEVPVDAAHAPLQHTALAPEAMQQAARDTLTRWSTRRTVRFYSDEHVPLSIVKQCVAAAGTAPSGAHKQPWTFVVVQDAEMKAKVREVVEAEERVNYESRMAEKWKEDLASMMSAIHEGGQTITKPYLTEAPYLVLVFAQKYGLDAQGTKIDHYYVTQSVGIAVGMFTAALHECSLCSLVSTPMGSESELKRLLNRPSNEKLWALMPVGLPATDATVPKRDPLRKPMNEIFVVV